MREGFETVFSVFNVASVLWNMKLAFEFVHCVAEGG